MTEPSPSIHNLPPSQIDPDKLRQVLTEDFNENELQDLCFMLQVDYESLPAVGKAAKARELVAHFQRRCHLLPLVEAILSQRPHLDTYILLRQSGQETSPFKGLLYFEEADADLFFGREALTAKLVAHLHHNSFLAVIGASGSGKSSLVRAGLLPVLKGKVVLDGVNIPPNSPHWLYHIISPQNHPLDELAETLTRHIESVTAFETLANDLRNTPRALHLTAQRLTKQAGVERLILVVDQFEELFTLCKDETERQMFVDNLLHAVTTDAAPTILIITLRADFYSHCLQYKALHLLLEQQQKIAPAMSQTELRQAIELPAQRSGLIFEPGLVELLLRDVGEEPGALPLLSHALLETWERREGHRLTFAGYSASGGVRGAIARTAETLYQNLIPDQQQIARNIFLRLTALEQETIETRRRVELAELAFRPNNELVIQEVLKRLADARLIITDQNSAEIAHEALIREWNTLQDWLNQNRHCLVIQQRLAEDALEWDDRQRDPTLLYQGTRLQEALACTAQSAIELNMVEQAFLIASRTHLEHLQQEQEAQQQKLQQEAEARKKAEAQVVFYIRLSTGVFLLFLIILSVNFIYKWYLHFWVQSPQVFIESGPAILGKDNHQVYLDAFSIDLYEVSNERYCYCVAADICQQTSGLVCDSLDESEAQLPVVNVSAVQAIQFCEWVGGTLPRSIDWERAARGQNGRIWPWGTQDPTPDRVYLTFPPSSQPLALIAVNDPKFMTGTTPMPEAGIMHLLGNAAEWTQTPTHCAEADTTCLDPWDGTEDVPLYVRGFSFTDVAQGISVTGTVNVLAQVGHPEIGLRCVYPAP